jgi:hypothetical protein
MISAFYRDEIVGQRTGGKTGLLFRSGSCCFSGMDDAAFQEWIGKGFLEYGKNRGEVS